MNKEEKEKLKKQAEEILKKEGNTRGENYLIAEYVEKKYGKNKVKELEELISYLLGRKYSFPEGRPKGWYKEAIDVVIILAAKNLFKWSDEKIFEVGKFHALHSFTMRVLLRYFVSLDRLSKDAPKYWEKHFDFSELEVVRKDNENNLKIRIKGYKFHPVMNNFYAGYFQAIANGVISSEEIRMEQTKDVYKGDPYIEYKISW